MKRLFTLTLVVLGSICASAVPSHAAATPPPPPPPVVTVNPANVSICDSVGSIKQAQFNCTATGTGLTFKWEFSVNGTIWNNATGAPYTTTSTATTSKLDINPTTPGMNLYQYRCIVTGGGADTTLPAKLLVSTLITITSQPGDTIYRCEGDNVTLNVGVSGTNLTYQWRYSTGSGSTDLSNGGYYQGVKTPTLIITGIHDAMPKGQAFPNGTYIFYNFYATNGCYGVGKEKYISHLIHLVINPGISITTQPTSKAACDTSAAAFNTTQFSISAIGAGIVYTWQMKTPSGSWVNVPATTPPYSGYKTNTLTISPVKVAMDSNQYRCIISNNSCTNDTSNAATLTVNKQPFKITWPPSQVNACKGGTTILNVTAGPAGSGITYQWKYSSGSTWGAIAPGTPSYTGERTQTLTINPVTLTTAYYQVDIYAPGCPIVSTPQTLVQANGNGVSITKDPRDTAACLLGTTRFQVSTTAAGGSYQWQCDFGTGIFSNITAGGSYGSPVNNPLILGTIPLSMSGYRFRCIMLNPGCTPDTSNFAVLTVNNPAVVTSQPVDVVICNGGNASFTVGATPAGVLYQWYSSPNASTWTKLTNTAPYSNVTTKTLGITGALIGAPRYYRCEVWTPGCSPVVSFYGQLLINAAAAITSNPVDLAICAGASGTFTVGTSGTPSGGYKWEFSTNGGSTWNAASAAPHSGNTTATLTLSGASVTTGMTGYKYRCIISNTGCANDTSVFATLTVNPQPTVTGVPATVFVCTGGSVNISATITPAGASIQWKSSVNPGGPWTTLVDGAVYGGTKTAILTIKSATLAMDPYYRCEVTVAGCTTVISGLATLNVSNGASISSNPPNTSVCVGANTTLGVGVSGTPSSYKWEVSTNGGTTWGPVSGSSYTGITGNPLGINSVPLSMNNYQYRCIITNNGCGPDTSLAAILTVNPAPTVGTPTPNPLNICVGNSGAFTVTFTPPGANVQWKSSATSSGTYTAASGGPYSGGTTGTLTIGPATLGMNAWYKCEVSIPGCPTTSTGLVQLNVTNGATISTDPPNTAVCIPPGNTTITAGITGSPSGIKWEYNIGSGTTWTTVPGATTATASLTGITAGMNGYRYRCIITNAGCGPDTSNFATLTVSTMPTVSNPTPNPLTICVGGTGAFSVNVTPAGASVQWKSSPTVGGTYNPPTGIYYSSSTANPLTISSAVTGLDQWFKCEVTVPGCPTVTSGLAQLVVTNGANIISGASNVSICAGVNATMGVTISGTPASTKWQVDCGSGFTDITGGTYTAYTSATLGITAPTVAMNGCKYRCIITNGGCGPDTSNVGILTVSAAPTITTQPVNVTACNGGNATFSIAANPGSAVIQWYSSTTGSGYTAIPGATNATYTITGVNGTTPTYFRCEVSVPGCTLLTSVTVRLTVNNGASITVDPVNTAACVGSNATFTSTVTGTPSSLKWQVDCGSGYTDITGGSYSNYTTANLTVISAQLVQNGCKYRLIAVNSGCANDTSAVAILSVSAAPTITTQPVNVTACNGGNATFTIAVNPGSASIQWYSSATGSGYTAIPGATNATYTITGVSGTTHTYFRCEVFIPGCTLLTSTTVRLTVNNGATITVDPVNTAACIGTNATFTTTVTGTPSSLRWQVDCGSGYTDITGGSYSNYTTANLTVISAQLAQSGCKYRLIAVNSGCANDTSAVAVLTVSAGASITTQPVNVSTCLGGNATFSVVVSPAGASIQWFSSATGTGYTPIAGATNATYTVTGVTGTTHTYFRCEISMPGCTTVTSVAVRLTINPVLPASVTIATPLTTICTGTTVTITATPTNGGTATYQWYKNGVAIPGATMNPYVTTAIAQGDTIYCIMTSSLACATGSPATSNKLGFTVSATAQASVSITFPPGSCSGSSIVFTANPTNGGSAPLYQWYFGTTPKGGNSAANQQHAGTYNNGDMIIVEMTPVGGCSTGKVRDTIILNVSPKVTPTVTINVPPIICAGTVVNFTATPVGGGSTPTYLWKKNFLPAAGIPGDTFKVTVVTGDRIDVVMTSNDPCATPKTASAPFVTVTVTPNVAASVTLSYLPNTNICPGTNVTFTAAPVNGGATPTWVWKVNGIRVTGANANPYITDSLKDGDQVTVEMTSSIVCVTGSPATATRTVNILPSLPVSVSITPPSPTICPGASVTFTAAGTNGGPGPKYQWYLNGSAIPGETNATYTGSGYTDGDSVYCIYTSNALCTTGNPAKSNIDTVFVTPNVNASVSITPTTVSICLGNSVTFTASPTNGGSLPTYQWKNKGVNIPGATLDSYTTAGLANGDIITCVMTSNAPCVLGSPAASNAVTVTVNPTVTASVSITAPTLQACQGDTLKFYATGVNGGTTPTFQWQNNGTDITGAITDSLIITSLNNGDQISCIYTSSLTCVTNSPDTSNILTVTINPKVTASVSIAGAPNTTICPNANITFTATPVNGGSLPTYQWQINGVNVPGATNDTYASTTWTNNDLVTCIMVSNAQCVTGSPDTSAAVKVTVLTPKTATISISGTPIPVCAGSSITFTATITNGGGGPKYEWQVNGLPVGTNPTYTSSAWTTGDVVTCILTSNAQCVSNPVDTSNSVTVTVTPTVPVSVSITASATNVCSGTPITFVATPTNGGTTPGYAWFKNGSTPIGSGNDSLVISTLSSGDIVTCELTSNVACPSGSPATSNGITITVIQSVTASVTISGTPTTICPGTTINFNAVGVNGGGAPTYQWQLNGVDIAGANTSTYSSSTWTNNDKVTCIFTSNAQCVQNSPDTSSAVTITVNPVVTAGVTISSTDTTFCAGTSVTFTAVGANPGSTPVYQWYLNGIPTVTGLTYTNAALATNDKIKCVLTSNAPCVQGSPATSDSIIVTVIPTTPTSISISGNPTSICAGSVVTFTAVPTNPGTTPAYQWKVNGIPVTGATTTTYLDSTLTSTDVVTCEMTSNAVCATPPIAISNNVSITVTPIVPAAVTITIPSPTICAGSPANFTAIPTNGGTTPAYQWYNKGVMIPGANLDTYSSSSLITGDSITVIMTSSLTCVSGSPATSIGIVVTVLPIVVPDVTIVSDTNNICSGNMVNFTATPVNGGTPTYEWQVNGANSGSGPTFSSTALLNGDQVVCIMTSTATCASPLKDTSNVIVLQVTLTTTAGVIITSTDTIICPDQVVDFTATPVNGGSAPVFQWKVNGLPVGTNSPTYSGNVWTMGDVVECEMISNAPCVLGSPANSTTITLIIDPAGTPEVTISTPSTDICSIDSVNLTAITVFGGSNPTYQWQVNGSNVGTNAPTLDINNLYDGDEITCIMTTSANCASKPADTSNVVTLNVTRTPEMNISINDAVVSCFGSPVTLMASGSQTVKWSPSDYLTCDTCIVTISNPMETIIYTAEGSNGDCKAYDTVLVEVKCEDVFIPTGFSPNGDNMNEVFKVYGPLMYDFSLKIFDRWGELIFETKDQNIGWDGTFKSRKMGSGVYIYMFTGTDYYGRSVTGNRARVLTGDVTLIR